MLNNKIINIIRRVIKEEMLIQEAGSPNIKLFDPNKESVSALADEIKSGLQGSAPFIETYSGTLGHWDYLYIRVILQPKEKWANGIKDNAASFTLYLEQNGSIKETRRHLYVKSKRPFYALDPLPVKFRKTTVKSAQEIISKIKNYINQITEAFKAEGHPL